MASATGAPVQLTHVNAAIAALETARQETMTWSSMKGGPESDGVVTYPIGYVAGKKYPLVLYIHGGPTSASKQTWTSYSQLFAAQGWMVFEPNYRGSDNLGGKYQAAIWNDAGAGPGEDVMAGLAVLERGRRGGYRPPGGEWLELWRVHDELARGPLEHLEGERGRRGGERLGGYV